MPKLPGAESLGQRPVPSAPGGTVAVRMVTGTEDDAGAAMTAAGRNVSAFADKLESHMKVEQEKADAIRAEEALTALRQRQLDLTYGDEEGFTHKKGSEAVNTNLHKNYREKLADAARALEHQLQTDGAKQKFRSRALFVGQQYEESILRHVTSERKIWEKQTVDGITDVETQAATRQWNDPTAVATSLTRIKGAVENYLATAPEEERKAEVLKRHQKVHAGVLGQMLVAERYVDAKNYLEQNRQDIDPATAKTVAKTTEDAAQKQLGNAYRAFYLRVQDDPTMLKQLHHVVTNDERLDEARKNVLINQIQTQQTRLDRKIEIANDKAMRVLQKQIDAVNSATLSGFPQTTENLLPLLSAAKGTELEGEASRALALANATEKFRLATPGAQEATISQAEALIRRDPGKFDIRTLQAFKTIHEAQKKAIKEDPQSFAVSQGLFPAALVDLSKPAEQGPAIAERASRAAVMRDRYNAPPKILTEEEVGTVTNFLRQASTQQKRDWFSGVATATQGQREAYRSIMGQIAPDNPPLAIAGVLAARSEPQAKATADAILRGLAILNPGRKEDGKPEGGKLWPMPSGTEKKAMDDEFASREGDAFAGRPQARSDYYQTALALYAAKASEAGITDGKYDKKLWREAIDQATGGIVQYRGKSVLKPWGMGEDQFVDAVRARIDAFEVGGLLDPDTATRAKRLPLEMIGDGRYVLRAGDAALSYTPKGDKAQIKNPDKTVSTERTIGIEMDGKHYVIPTIINGKQLSEDAAVLEFRLGRQKALGEFNTKEEADAFAKKRTAKLSVDLRPQPLIIDLNQPVPANLVKPKVNPQGELVTP
jgi:hypothetical protein